MIMKKIVKPYKVRKPSASTDIPSFARGKDQILKSPARLYGSVNVLDNDRKTRTFKSLELPEVVVTADRRPYKSYFDGSIKNTLNTIGSMFGLGYDGGKDNYSQNGKDTQSLIYYDSIGKNGNPSEIRTYLGSGNMLAFVSSKKPNYIFARKSQLKNPDEAGQILVHEGNHSQTDLLYDFINKYQKNLHYDIGTTEFGGYDADDLLEKAYNFSDEALKKVNSPIDEKAATNREIRFDLFKRTGKTGNELDEVIDNLSDSDLKNLLSNYSNYYRRQFRRNFKSDTGDYMRKALKIIPATLPIAIGASLYNDRDGDPNYNYNKGKDSGIHIKKANRGKFTAAAKRAGMGVQAYARKILSAPKGKYSPQLRRRANFARNASKFKH